MDITFQPDQMVPAGRYIVILRPVSDVSGAEMPPQNLASGEVDEGLAPVAPAASQIMPPPQNMANENGNGNVNGSMNESSSGQKNNNNTEYNMGVGGKRGKKQMKMTKKAKKAKGTRKLSPYMKFAQEARPKILKENPEMKSDIIGVGRRIGEMWRALSEAEKARY
ncbi:MAG: hypothetical protein EBU82_11870 [Flavobacteriia bacterium]|jgi:HMG (high mobility group) box|nr:hypothetical protein [Flavobacteriia bacterium]